MNGPPALPAAPEIGPWPVCCAGCVRVTVPGLRRRATPDAAGAIQGAWPAAAQLSLWARVGDWVLLIDLAATPVIWGWSHAAYVEGPHDLRIYPKTCSGRSLTEPGARSETGPSGFFG